VIDSFSSPLLTRSGPCHCSLSPDDQMLLSSSPVALLAGSASTAISSRLFAQHFFLSIDRFFLRLSYHSSLCPQCSLCSTDAKGEQDGVVRASRGSIGIAARLRSCASQVPTTARDTASGSVRWRWQSRTGSNLKRPLRKMCPEEGQSRRRLARFPLFFLAATTSWLSQTSPGDT
jgi:hypothetical protein